MLADKNLEMFGFFRKNKGQNLDKQLTKLIKSINKQISYTVYSPNDLKSADQYKQLKLLPESEKKILIIRLLNHNYELRKLRAKDNFSYKSDDYNYYAINITEAVVQGLLRTKLNYNEEEWITLFKTFENIKHGLSNLDDFYFRLSNLPITYAIKQLEWYAKVKQLSNPLINYVKQILSWEEFENPNNDHYWGSDMVKSKAKLLSLAGLEENPDEFIYKSQDIAIEVNKIATKIDKHYAEYVKLFRIFSSVSGAKPTAKIARQFDQLINIIGNDHYKKVVHNLLEIPAELNHTDYYKENPNSYKVDYYLCGSSQTFIKGLVWTCTRFSDKTTIQLLIKIIEKSYSKIPGKGPAAAALGNAGIYVLGNMRGKDGLGALSRLKLKVRQNNVKKSIDRLLLLGAEKYKVSVEELKEMAVPDFALSNGCKNYDFEDYSLSISISGSKVALQWFKPDGTTIKSVPSVVKNNKSHKQKLQSIRKEVKEIQKVYSAQKQRIDNQFILDRKWDYISFEKYYFQHGLVSPITKKLIWSFIKAEKSTTAIFINGSWCTTNGEVVDWIDEKTFVKLWHPINADEQQIVDWRKKIMKLEWRQPVKQAFREIYILTDAEINTKTYSNRMAAHILKQHQFSSLASIRNWKYSLMGAYDDGIDNQICYRVLPEYNMKAEFWIDELSQDDAWNDTGIWLYIATDQVKFLDANQETIDLVQVPKIVFSEIMRDVDLFVGVASVGNDPQWIDNNGERQNNRNYWHSYSFGDLTEIAKTRKTILESLLPRLTKISDIASIVGKFLIIKGKLRTYKIHIGSGNILMEPNDQYLCIVPSRSANTTSKLFIPFEGDRGLSIVLSKAFLLAEDDKITDSTITSQIKRNL